MSSWILILYVNEILDRNLSLLPAVFRFFFLSHSLSVHYLQALSFPPPLLSFLLSFCVPFSFHFWDAGMHSIDSSCALSKRAFACHCFSICSIHPFIQSQASRNICLASCCTGLGLHWQFLHFSLDLSPLDLSLSFLCICV